MKPARARPKYAPRCVEGSRVAWRAIFVLALLAGLDVHAQVPDQQKETTGTSSNEAPRRLEPVEVTGKKTETYTVTNATTATKTDTPLIETPASVQVVPRQGTRRPEGDDAGRGAFERRRGSGVQHRVG